MDTSASLLQRLRAGGEDADWQRLVRLYTPLDKKGDATR
jgi:hypothetical protein